MLLFHALEPQDLILGFPELIPGGGELELHLIKLAAGLLEVCFANKLLFIQVFFLGAELFQLVGPGEDACFLVDGSAAPAA